MPTKLFGREIENQMAFVGLANAGKTTLVKRLKGDENLETVPTMGMNIETLKIGDIEVMAADLGGQPTYPTSLWEPFVSKASGIVFVFDSADRSKVEKAGKWLKNVIQWSPEDSAFLFLANKQDLEEAMSLESIIHTLGLEKEMAARPRSFAVYPCSALTGEGVDEPWQWMSDKFRRQMSRKNV
ncbi:MAG: GTP-binding protein [Candidatus Heimdallarchaeota archaeon]|nr:MAG: GTP-binding protein [Candidatus Heimdallarchaeota archaeon]